MLLCSEGKESRYPAVGEIRIVVLTQGFSVVACLGGGIMAEIIGSFSVTIFVEKIMRHGEIYG